MEEAAATQEGGSPLLRKLAFQGRLPAGPASPWTPLCPKCHDSPEEHLFKAWAPQWAPETAQKKLIWNILLSAFIHCCKKCLSKVHKNKKHFFRVGYILNFCALKQSLSVSLVLVLKRQLTLLSNTWTGGSSNCRTLSKVKRKCHRGTRWEKNYIRHFTTRAHSTHERKCIFLKVRLSTVRGLNRGSESWLVSNTVTNSSP